MPESLDTRPSAHPKRGGAKATRWLLACVAVLLAVGALFLIANFGGNGDRELSDRVARLQHVVWIGDARPPLSTVKDTITASHDDPALQRALDGVDEAAFDQALVQKHVDGVLAAFKPIGQARTISERLRALEPVRGLRGDYLTATWALYVPDPLQKLAPTLQTAIATVARGLIAGQRAPRVTSFPEPLRRVQNVEVMVLIRRDGRALLWRSARGSSIARSLLTAGQMARRRWIEREQALGGSLDRLLPKLEIEVALLHEDGTLGERNAAFVDRAFTKDHGVAYERRGSWHYLLPDATQHDGHGSAAKAYAKLFEDNGLPAASLERADLRLYRMLVTTLATSPATEASEDDPTRVNSPADVLMP